MTRPRFLPDNFTLALVFMVLLASFLPCEGKTAYIIGWITKIFIAFQFFFHGAKLSREAVIRGMTHWRLHLSILASTYLVFPLVGFLLKPLIVASITPELYLGIVFMCFLPSTVQSSIAFTSIGKGNVPAAVCSASASNLLGVFITPLMVGLFIGKSGGAAISFNSVSAIVLQILVPFILGQLVQPRVAGWIEKRSGILRYTDQGTILMVVYTAFSAAVIEGLWKNTPPVVLLTLAALCLLFLLIMLLITTYGSRLLGFSKEDEIAIVMCGAKKTLGTGVPIANVLFAPHMIGTMLLPIMIFHQIQLMVCAMLAQRYAKRQRQSEA